MKVRGKVVSFVAVALVAAGLTPVVGGVSPASAALPTVSVGDLQVVETDIGKGAVTIPVTLDAPAPAAVKVRLAIVGGTAAKKTDYTGKPTIATIPKGQVAGAAKLTLVGDGVVEPNETVSVQAAPVAGATIADGTGQVTISDNDANGVSATPEIRTGRPTVWEGNTGTRMVRVPVTLSRPASTPVTIGFADQCRGQAVTFKPGAVAATVKVAVLGDVAHTSDRVMKNAVGLVAGPASNPSPAGDTTVRDDDGGPAAIGVGGLARVALRGDGSQPTYPNYAASDPEWVFPESTGGSISDNGRYVAFESNATDLVDCDTNNATDVFAKDLVTGAIERVSVASNGAQANGLSRQATISADGRYVVFESHASNLVPNDSNSWPDIFVHDRVLHTTERVLNTGAGPGGSVWGSISADGRYVALNALAPLAGDVDNCPPAAEQPCTAYDAYVVDRVTNQLTLISAGANGSPTWVSPSATAISADGSTVIFSDGGTVWAVDRVSGAAEQLSVDSNEQPLGKPIWLAPTAISGDGQRVAFTSICNPSNGCGALSGDVFLRDRAAGTTIKLNVDAAGNPLPFDFPLGVSLSRDGRYAAFDYGKAAETVPSGCSYNDGAERTFQRDLVTGTVVVVGRSATGFCPTDSTMHGTSHATSADGKYVVFTTQASTLLAGDTNGVYELYVKRLR
jgi:Tol biopolymer transport system component